MNGRGTRREPLIPISVDETGMTIVEVLVASALMAILILGMAAQQFYQGKVSGDSQLGAKAQQVVASLINSIAGSGSQFPAWFNNGVTNTPSMWAACFGLNGQMVTSAATGPAGAVLGYSLITSIDPTASGSPAAFDTYLGGPPPGTPTLCNVNTGGNPGGYEVHVFNNAANFQLQISVIVLPTPARPYNPSTSVFTALAYLGTLPQTATGPMGGFTNGIWCSPPGSAGCGGRTSCTLQQPTTNMGGAAAPIPNPKYYFCF